MRRGFTLLYAVLVVGTLMGLVFALLNIVYKQIAISTINKFSSTAYYAADSGLECARYWSEYGVFNTTNPFLESDSHSVTCAGRTVAITTTAACTGNTCTLDGVGNPLSAGTFDTTSFSYPLTLIYSAANDTAAPQTTVDIWQNENLEPDPTITDIDTGNSGSYSSILATGLNTGVSSLTQTQRGAGEAVQIPQCLAQAFTYTSGSGSYPDIQNGFSNDNLVPTLAPFWPGIPISSLNLYPECLSYGKTTAPKNVTCSNFPYISNNYGIPDSWTYTPSGTMPAALSVSSAFLSSDSEYVFGYYTDSTNISGTWVQLADSSAAIGTNPVLALPSGQTIHFAFGVPNPAGGAPDPLWSTDVSDNQPDIGNSHILVFSTPMPLASIPSGGTMELGGKYLFALDNENGGTLPPSPAYDNAVVEMQLVNCP